MSESLKLWKLFLNFPQTNRYTNCYYHCYCSLVRSTLLKYVVEAKRL